jgi:AraC-like DNA-binding protein
MNIYFDFVTAQAATPVGHVAGLLGYSETAPFTSAFRKWTGRSPLQWRKDQLSPPAE